MSKILVTGGCGYIGSHTIVDLIDNGFEVISVDNNIRSKKETIDRIFQITGKRIKNYKIDICNIKSLRKIFIKEDIKCIVHFAALKSVPESVKKPLLYFNNNIISLINLLQMCEEFNISKFIFSSSCSVYGNTIDLPVTENSIFLNPESPYARTKQISEGIINDFSKISNVKFIILRYFNPVGAHESILMGEDNPEMSGIIPRITSTAIGKFDIFEVFGNDYSTQDGTCIRDYIHVMDIANAHTKSLLYIDNVNDPLILNLGSGKGITILEIIKSFESISGVKLNWKFSDRRSGDVVEIYANNDKAKSILNWDIKRNMDEILKTAWEWQLKIN